MACLACRLIQLPESSFAAAIAFDVGPHLVPLITTC